MKRISSEPNVLWVTLESVRADHTSLHGYRKETTPNLRELSTRPDATVLEPVISGSMWTPASTASMLTGTHMSTHQVGRDGKCERKLPQSVDTLPQRLSDAGYTTALFSPIYYIGPETGLDRGFDHVESLSIRKGSFIGYDSVTRDTVYCGLRCVLEGVPASVSALKRDISNSKNYLLEHRFKRWCDRRTEPFFCYAHIPSPHHTYRAIARFRHEFVDDIRMDESEALETSERVYNGTEGIRERMASGLDLSESEWEAIEAMYDAEIRYADHTVGQFVSLARTASDRPLVVIITGDHGDLFGTYGLIGHNLVLHDGLIKVPGLVLGVKDVVDTPETVTQHIDLTYTVASVTGVSTEQFQGRDLRDASRPYAISQRGVAHLNEYTKHEEQFGDSRFFREPFTCVRTTRFKYLSNDNRTKLYDLPNEESNLASDYPSVVEDFSEILCRENIDWDRRSEGERVEFDEQAQSQLRDLGYLT